MAVKVYTIVDPDTLFEPGSPLFGFDPDVVSGEDYENVDARALFEALGASPEDEDFILGELPDGRWAVVGLMVAGHKFAVEEPK